MTEISWKSPDEPPEHRDNVLATVVSRNGDRETEDLYYWDGKWRQSHVSDSFGDSDDLDDGEEVIAWTERPEPATERVELRMESKEILIAPINPKEKTFLKEIQEARDELHGSPAKRVEKREGAAV